MPLAAPGRRTRRAVPTVPTVPAVPTVLAVVAVSLTGASGCTAATVAGEQPAPVRPPVSAPVSGPGPVSPDDVALDAALSTPREDSLYPDVGDPGVDALHYALDLAWDPDGRRLEATERLVLRAASTAPTFRLDLAEQLRVREVLLDGEPVASTHRGKDLVVRSPVVVDDRHVLELTYAGRPEPVAAPTSRGDLATTGWTTMPDGTTWTMQEPFGAYTWYAVNDHPSDKALYDITVEVPSPWVGVANGVLEARTRDHGTTRTSWHLDEPAAAYLVTVATGPFELHEDTSASGVPISTWTAPDLSAQARRGLAVAPRAMTWIEERLGPYPFDSLGFVTVASTSGMETQTMITLGDTAYTTSPEVVVHEMVHQWYGDQVTPDDWRDVWMSEGMTMYLQLLWEADHGGRSIQAMMDTVADLDRGLRRAAGPPGAYDADAFADSNVYYVPALMWHQLRLRLGDEVFWAMVRAWPAARDGLSTGREDYWAWVEDQTGEELSRFFVDWLLSEVPPPVS